MEGSDAADSVDATRHVGRHHLHTVAPPHGGLLPPSSLHPPPSAPSWEARTRLAAKRARLARQLPKTQQDWGPEYLIPTQASSLHDLRTLVTTASRLVGEFFLALEPQSEKSSYSGNSGKVVARLWARQPEVEAFGILEASSAQGRHTLSNSILNPKL